MSEVSKQYVVLTNDPKAHYDFDVIKIFNKLKVNTLQSIICEGLGFTAIANIEGKCKVGFPIVATEEYQWYPIELVTRWTHNRFFDSSNKQVLLLEQDERADQDLEQWNKSFEMIVDQPYNEWKKDLKNISEDEYYWIVEKDMYRVSCDAGEQFLKLHRILK